MNEDLVYDGEIPFTLSPGSMLGHHVSGRTTLKPHPPFREHLYLVGIGRGRSACDFYWAKYPLSGASELLDRAPYPSEIEGPYYSMMLPNFRQVASMLHSGALYGWWGFRKQGGSYGLIFLGSRKPELK